MLRQDVLVFMRLFQLSPALRKELRLAIARRKKKAAVPAVRRSTTSKHVDWGSLLRTRRCKLLRDYADENSCPIFGPDSRNTNQNNLSIIPDVLDMVITK